MSLNPINANSGAVTAIAGDAIVLALASGGGYAPVTFADLAKAVRDSISIGGRNLLLDSAVEVNDSKYNIVKCNYSELPKVGDKLMITLWGELGADRERFDAYNGNGYPEKGMVRLTKVADGVYRGVLEIKQDPAACPYIQFYHIPQSATSKSIIHRVKAEYGNVYSDWSPAPEDLRGGVIGSQSITYAFGEKGGAHERGSSQFSRLLQGPADGIVSCESFRALEEFVGRACAVESAGADFSMSDMLGCERGYARMDEDKCGYLESPIRGEQIGWVHPYTPVRFQCKDSVLPSLGRDRESVNICQEAYLGKLRGRFLAGMVSDVTAGKEVAV